MKKLFAYLLIIFVFVGTLFAADLPGVATLTLSTTVTDYVYHGFFPEAPSGAIVFDEEHAINNTISGIILDDSSVDFGYYGLFINLPSQVQVSFALNSLKTTAGSDVWYVPYKLSVSQAGQDGVRFGSSFFTATTFGSDAAAAASATGDPLANSGEVVFTTSGSGNGYIALKLNASFNSTNLQRIPSGSYSGSIVATITTP